MIRQKPKQTGIEKIILATGYSWQGLKFVFKNEWAFRAELVLSLILMPVIYILELNKIEKLFLISSLFVILLMELVNSAIEALVDRISLEQHPLSKAAKDIGSSLIFVSFVCFCFVWFFVLVL